MSADPATLEAMWSLANTFLDAMPGRYLSLVINKSDLLADGETCALPEQATASGLPIMLTSAKDNLNVKQTFQDAAATIVRHGL